MAIADPMLQLVAAALVLVLPVAALAIALRLHPRAVAAAAVAGTVAAIAVLAVDALLVMRVDRSPAVLDAAAAAAVTTIVALLAAQRVGILRATVLAALWGAAVLPLVLLATVGSVPSALQRALGAVDAGGALATHAAGAAAVLVVTLLPRAFSAGRPTAGDPVSTEPPAPTASRGQSTRTAIAVVLLGMAAVAWMVGVDRVVSEASGRLAVNAAAGILIGAAMWLIVARLSGRRLPAGGGLLGAALGWAAVGSGGAFLGPVALGSAAVLGSAAGAMVSLRLPPTAVPLRRPAVGVLITVTVGGVITSLLADGFGLAATGATIGSLTQTVAVLIVALLSGLAAAVAGTAAAGVAALVGMVERRSASSG